MKTESEYDLVALVCFGVICFMLTMGSVGLQQSSIADLGNVELAVIYAGSLAFIFGRLLKKNELGYTFLIIPSEEKREIVFDPKLDREYRDKLLLLDMFCREFYPDDHLDNPNHPTFPLWEKVRHGAQCARNRFPIPPECSLGLLQQELEELMKPFQRVKKF